jgi:ribosomal protein L35
MRHILTSKGRSRKRRLKRSAVVESAMKNSINHLLP